MTSIVLKWWRAALAAMITLLVPIFAHAYTSGRPLEREAARIRQLLFDGKFAELEAVERRTRDLSLVVSDGQQLRSAYAQAVANAWPFLITGDPQSELVQLRSRVSAWEKMFPGSNAARIAEASYFLQDAWRARGGNYAYAVGDNAWSVYNKDVLEAARILDGMGRDARDQPEWYVMRLAVMRLGKPNDADYERLLDEALGRYPRYLSIFFEAAAYYAPRWHGSNAKLNAFIEKAASMSRPWLGDAMYARLQWSVWTGDMFRNGQASWPRMKSSFGEIVKAYPDTWNLNNFANFACMAHDAATTREQLKRIEGSVTIEAWDSMDFYAKCKAWALAERAQPSALATTPESLACNVGPVEKKILESSWLLYSCNDGASLVLVAPSGSTAFPFVFMFQYTSQGYRLSGEGAGSKAVTDQVLEVLNALTARDVANLVDLTKRAEKK